MTLSQFMCAVKDRKSVTGFHTRGLTGQHMPAAFIASMQFTRVIEALPRLKIYEPVGRKNRPWRILEEVI